MFLFCRVRWPYSLVVHMNCVSLASYIEDADLGIRHTSAIAGLGVRLVLIVAVALCRSPTHDDPTPPTVGLCSV